VGRCAVPFSGTAAIGLINLIYNLGRYEQIVRLKLLLSEPESHEPPTEKRRSKPETTEN
jgi:hypothetical protein